MDQQPFQLNSSIVAKDKRLFTPGPLTTSRTVKEAMLHDAGSRDAAFIQVVRAIRARLVTLAGVSEDEYTAVLMQGSGTFGVESVISSTVAEGGRLLVIVNGAYGRRIAQIAATLNIAVTALAFAEDSQPNLRLIEDVLTSDESITDVAVVHCETTSGILNPVHEIGALVKRFERSYIVDAMSSFGAVPIDVAACHIDYLISSANKCIEGVPGFSFVVARKVALIESEGCARSVSLDLVAQWRELQAHGQFRFTPPTHAILAFHQALLELEAEGGVAGRAERYHRNHAALVAGMRALGFREYLRPEDQSDVITSFYAPSHPYFDFKTFYSRLSDKGFVIYPGKISNADCFRIGAIGRLFEADIRDLLTAIQQTLAEMQVVLSQENNDGTRQSSRLSRSAESTDIGLGRDDG